VSFGFESFDLNTDLNLDFKESLVRDESKERVDEEGELVIVGENNDCCELMTMV
jgi:hypothetical protein